MFRQLGPTELLIIVGVIVLLFGAKKLPDLARGSGQALRIFKAETKELREKDKPAGTAGKADEIVVDDSATTRPVEADRRTDSGS